MDCNFFFRSRFSQRFALLEPCQRLNRHGLQPKILNFTIYDFIYVLVHVSLEVPSQQASPKQVPSSKFVYFVCTFTIIHNYSQFRICMLQNSEIQRGWFGVLFSRPKLCRDTRLEIWRLFADSKVKVCRPKVGTHILIFSLQLSCKILKNCEIGPNKTEMQHDTTSIRATAVAKYFGSAGKTKCKGNEKEKSKHT